ncbi:MAG TPA: hypothetical protein PLD92_06060 [Candidatus Omnitrophota bacterium]|nr:hypothetical protein [Candidatus Omnitrophota bacterium]
MQDKIEVFPVTRLIGRKIAAAGNRPDGYRKKAGRLTDEPQKICQ